jgi:hypothetical protein
VEKDRIVLSNPFKESIGTVKGNVKPLKAHGEVSIFVLVLLFLVVVIGRFANPPVRVFTPTKENSLVRDFSNSMPISRH